MKRTLLFSLILLSAACSRGTRDWMSGVSHVKCPIYETLYGNVVNASGKDLTIGFCSSKYKLDGESKSIPNGESREYSTEVGQHDNEYEVMLADSCNEASDYQSAKYQDVGVQIPVLSTADSASYHTCYGAHVEFTNESGSIFQDQKVFKILPKSQPCTAGYKSLEDAGLSCI